MDMPAVPRIKAADTHRPPGALNDEDLLETCPGCGDCVEVCPLQIIELDRSRLPALSAAKDCTHCGLCVDVCMFGALHHTPETQHGLAEVLRLERDG
jgi:ferredoxin